MESWLKIILISVLLGVVMYLALKIGIWAGGTSKRLEILEEDVSKIKDDIRANSGP